MDEYEAQKSGGKRAKSKVVIPVVFANSEPRPNIRQEAV